AVGRGVEASAPSRLARPQRRGCRGRMSLDRIELRGLRARGRHGCLPAERELGQVFVVDAVLGLDTRPAAEEDDLARTVDYGALADRLATICLEDATVSEVEITVHKPSAPVPHPFTDVAVKIRRNRQ